ncbi:hypothetical protein [Burkholderia glumae]|uniref:Uncharacterized protein n=1 Tax=Burkholderia glumae TaxID=337 RepID=A0ABY5BF47_BURGL|nr:hypothetical protein [Burkholderia glumae]QKM47711.1 hypothetical protein B7760_01735 [Burkholderia glumae]QTP33480.1 hypothetical protein B7759_02074 [Burkholderia glumae]USS45071.1 hypothetical protein NFI99_26130 [Burkholderia glumae]
MRTLADEHPMAVALSLNEHADRFYANELRRVEQAYFRNLQRQRGIKTKPKRQSPAERIAERQRRRNLESRGAQ